MATLNITGVIIDSPDALVTASTNVVHNTVVFLYNNTKVVPVASIPSPTATSLVHKVGKITPFVDIPSPDNIRISHQGISIPGSDKQSAFYW